MHFLIKLHSKISPSSEKEHDIDVYRLDAIRILRHRKRYLQLYRQRYCLDCYVLFMLYVPLMYIWINFYVIRMLMSSQTFPLHFGGIPGTPSTMVLVLPVVTFFVGCSFFEFRVLPVVPVPNTSRFAIRTVLCHNFYATPGIHVRPDS